MTVGPAYAFWSRKKSSSPGIGSIPMIGILRTTGGFP
jgi:hypothetical protein